MDEAIPVRTLNASGVPYETARRWQLATAAAVREARTTGERGVEAVAMIEHAAVYTMGARGGRESLRLPEGDLPAPVVDTDRGGDITWHGPGQLVVYPILDLRARGLGAGAYIEALEGMLLDTLAAFGIAADLVEGRRGVWIGDEKIAALGIRVQGGVSLHGIALNVCPDLAWFDPIVPCGLEDAGVTSMSRVLGRTVRVGEARRVLREAFVRRFEARFDDLACAVASEALAGGHAVGETATREAVSA